MIRKLPRVMTWFDRRWNYDAVYMGDVIGLNPRAVVWGVF
jgi:hypothetical protein